MKNDDEESVSANMIIDTTGNGLIGRGPSESTPIEINMEEGEEYLSDTGDDDCTLYDTTEDSNLLFRHLFDPKILLSDTEDVDFTSLEIQCMVCTMKAPIRTIYCHAADVHCLNLCVYCLATFQHGRQLQVHLLREHRIMCPDLTDFDDFDQVFGPGNCLACIECNRLLPLTGVNEQDDLIVAEHECHSEVIHCVKCIRSVAASDILSHMERCSGRRTHSPPKKTPSHLLKGQEEVANEDQKVTQSKDNSPSKVITFPALKKIEPARLRNRENRCDICLEVVSPSKRAQHLYECEGPHAIKEADSELSGKLPDSSTKHRSRSNLQKLSQRTVAAKSAILSATSNGNLNSTDAHSTTDAAFTPLQPSECFLSATADESSFLLDSDAPVTSMTDTTLQTETPPYSPKKSDSEATVGDSLQQSNFIDVANETVDVSSSCDIKPNNQVYQTEATTVRASKYDDPVLNEEDPDKRRLILLQELSDMLENQLRQQLRFNDNLDPRTNLLDLTKPVTEYCPDAILEVMISNASSCCTYCRQARIVGVDRRQLVIHLMTQHKWQLQLTPELNELRDGSTMEEEKEGTDGSKANHLQGQPEDWQTFKIVLLEKVFKLSDNVFNFPGREPFGTSPCECLLCGNEVSTQRLLFAHWYKQHPHQSMKCYMCHQSFLFVGALFSHLCFGTTAPITKEAPVKKTENGDISPIVETVEQSEESSALLRYQCGLCDNVQLPGFFNYIVHIRMLHNLCELCLQPLADQKDLHTHILKKHKLNHYCWKCKLPYSDTASFFSHMFWKHGNCGRICNMCCEKKWSFVYHFCRPPTEFSCDVCKERFTKPVSLLVHKRIHTLERMRKCPKHNCQDKFISKKLLEKHLDQVHNPALVKPAPVTSSESVPSPPTAPLEDVVKEEAVANVEEEEDSLKFDVEDTANSEKKEMVQDLVEVEKPLNDPVEKCPIDESETIEPSSNNPEDSSSKVESETAVTPSQPEDVSDPINAKECKVEGDVDVEAIETLEAVRPPEEGEKPVEENNYEHALGTDAENIEDNLSSFVPETPAETPTIEFPLKDSEAICDNMIQRLDIEQFENNANQELPQGESAIGNDQELTSVNDGCNSLQELGTIDQISRVSPTDLDLRLNPSLLQPNSEQSQKTEDEILNGKVDESGKRFDIADYQGPNLSEEEESDGEGSGENKKSKPFVSEAMSTDEVITTPEKSQCSLDLNGHENYFAYGSPDIANYEHLLEDHDIDSAVEPSPSPMDVGPIDESFPCHSSSQAPNLHQDLLLSSDSDDEDEKKSLEELANNIDENVEPSPTMNCIDAIDENIGGTANTSEKSTVCEENVTDSRPEHTLQPEANLTACGLKITKMPYVTEDDPLPTHIAQEEALRTLQDEHDYWKLHLQQESEPFALQGPIGDSSLIDNGIYRNPYEEKQPTVEGDVLWSAGANSTAKTNELSHSRKRTRSPSTSSSSSSSSSDSSSESSSDSTGSESEEGDSDAARSPKKVSPKKIDLSQVPEFSPYGYQSQAGGSHHGAYNSSSHYGSPTASTPPVKRGRGRPKGSLNRDKYGIPTAKKFQGGRSYPSSKSSKNGDDAYKPRRKYRKTKGKVGRPKSAATLEKEKEEKEKLIPKNEIPESDLETEESGGEEEFQSKQLTEPIWDKIPASDRVWSISNEEYLLRLLRGVESLEKLKLLAETKVQPTSTEQIEKKVDVSRKKIGSPQFVNVRMPKESMSAGNINRIHPGPMLTTTDLPVPVRRPKIKIGLGRGRGRGRGRGKGKSASSEARVNYTTELNYVTNRAITHVQSPQSYYELSVPSTSFNSNAHNDAEVREDDEVWCICRRPYGGRDMIECEFKGCPFKWYHLDCIGLSQQDVPKGKWFCKIEKCKEARSKSNVAGKRKRQNERLVGHYAH